MDGVEIRIDLGCLRIEQPVVEDKHFFPVHFRCLILFDDQRAVKAARDLFNRSVVGMVPIGARIRRDKIVVEGLTRLHGGLSQSCHPIHGVVDTDAVPMDRASLGQCVPERPLHSRTPSDPQFGAGHHAVVAPDVCLGVGWGCQLRRSRARREFRERPGFGTRRNGQGQSRDRCRAVSQEFPPRVHSLVIL